MEWVLSADLPKGFIENDTRSHRQIETADIWITHGNG